MINVQITSGGTDITYDIINYTRQEDICSSAGSIEITLRSDTNYVPHAQHQVILNEESHKKATYNIDSF